MRAPENTLAGFRKAAALGVRAVEFDVRLTADGRCILLHDDTVDRTTDGKGRADRMMLEDLAGLDAGAWCRPAAHHMICCGRPAPGRDRPCAGRLPKRTETLAPFCGKIGVKEGNPALDARISRVSLR
jgi:hypothetical protein